MFIFMLIRITQKPSPGESRHWDSLLMPRPSLAMPGPLRHNCPSLQRVALRGLSQLGVNLSQWPGQNRRPICLPQGGTYSVINLDLELRTGPFFPFPSHPLAVLFQDNRSTSRALKEALLKEWTSSENTGCVLMSSHRSHGDRLLDSHGDPQSTPSPPGYPGHHSWTSLMEHH